VESLGTSLRAPVSELDILGPEGDAPAHCCSRSESQQTSCSCPVIAISERATAEPKVASNALAVIEVIESTGDIAAEKVVKCSTSHTASA
jgi:hypothetical protein